MVVGVAAHKVVVAGPLFVRIELASTVSADVLFPCQACKGAFNDFGRPAVFLPISIVFILHLSLVFAQDLPHSSQSGYTQHFMSE